MGIVKKLTFHSCLGIFQKYPLPASELSGRYLKQKWHLAMREVALVFELSATSVLNTPI